MAAPPLPSFDEAADALGRCGALSALITPAAREAAFQQALVVMEAALALGLSEDMVTAAYLLSSPVGGGGEEINKAFEPKLLCATRC